MSSFIPVYYEGAIFDWALVDEDDYERVSDYRWCRASIHAVASSSRREGLPNLRGISMHRFILGVERGDGVIHHVNEDGLDNRRSNLKHVANAMAHWSEPHPRWRKKCAPHAKRVSLPPLEREVALATIWTIAA